MDIVTFVRSRRSALMLALWLVAVGVGLASGCGGAGGGDKPADAVVDAEDGSMPADGAGIADAPRLETICQEGGCGVGCAPCPAGTHCVAGQCRDLCPGEPVEAGVGLWSLWMDAFEDDSIRRVLIDPDGNAYIFVNFEVYSLAFEDSVLPELKTAGGEDFVVVKVSAAGEAEWALQVGGPEDDGVVDAALDGDGNVFLAGAFESSTLKIADCMLESKKPIAGFLARLSPSGECLYADDFTVSEWTLPTAVAVKPGGAVVVAGLTGLMEDFPDPDVEEPWYFELFLAELESTDSPGWSWTRPGSGYVEIDSLEVDKAGHIYLSGLMLEPGMDFGGGMLLSAGGLDGFVARYAPDGQHEWSIQHGTPGIEIIERAAVDAAGNVCVAGSYKSPTLNTGRTTHDNKGQFDNFVVCLDSTGKEIWSDSFGDVGWDFVDGVAADAWGNVYVSGDIAVGATAGEMGFDGFAPFIRKYNGQGQVDWHAQYWLGVFFGNSSGLAVRHNGDFVVGWSLEDPGETPDDPSEYELGAVAITQSGCPERDE